MKKHLKRIKNCIFIILSVLIIGYILCVKFFPEKTASLIGYRGYVILTDSMEPTIPTHSLVLVKTLKEGEEPKLNSIISFHANRFGENIVLTHYFRKNALDENGRKLYRTKAEGVDNFDAYQTYREDITGTYVTHIPYIGKFVLFLQSPFALIELAILGVITVIYNILWMKFDKEEQNSKNDGQTEEKSEEQVNND